MSNQPNEAVESFRLDAALGLLAIVLLIYILVVQASHAVYAMLHEDLAELQTRLHQQRQVQQQITEDLRRDREASEHVTSQQGRYGRPLIPVELPDGDLTILIDRSGSMAQDGRAFLAYRHACALVLNSCRRIEHARVCTLGDEPARAVALDWTRLAEPNDLPADTRTRAVQFLRDRGMSAALAEECAASRRLTVTHVIADVLSSCANGTNLIEAVAATLTEGRERFLMTGRHQSVVLLSDGMHMTGWEPGDQPGADESFRVICEAAGVIADGVTLNVVGLFRAAAFVPGDGEFAELDLDGLIAAGKKGDTRLVQNRRSVRGLLGLLTRLAREYGRGNVLLVPSRAGDAPTSETTAGLALIGSEEALGASGSDDVDGEPAAIPAEPSPTAPNPTEITEYRHPPGTDPGKNPR